MTKKAPLPTAAAAVESDSERPVVALISAHIDMSFMRGPIAKAMPEADIRLWPKDDVTQADVALCWRPPHDVLGEMKRLRLVHGIGAGVDNILSLPDLPDVPVCRVVDPNHARGIVEYASWATLFFHRDFDVFQRNRLKRAWVQPRQRRAANVTVGIMGWGNLGRAVGSALKALGYTVRAWARTAHEEEGIEFFAGDGERAAFLEGTNILIALLPLTAGTNGILNADLFAGLPKGAAVVNIGRGELVNEPDLLASLDAGHLRGAVLDVFVQEPLPEDNPLWVNPRVFVTPHIASMADPDVIASQFVENIRRAFAGEAVINEVDRTRGY
ncbi:glyoxylate/hydroxypyruvate reductase A [Breoghania sp.]|uniref:2-hydroxyacid dehydrogenase n=1 Tax=Breoghania sp. TaxID=2065378 RepID=UPI002AA865A3|nr:glyoxylate/hydroxypyruvate reductase A [Breoghania sp.]